MPDAPSSKPKAGGLSSLPGKLKSIPPWGWAVAAVGAYLAYKWYVNKKSGSQSAPQGSPCYTTDPNTGYATPGIVDSQGNCLPTNLMETGAGGGPPGTAPAPGTTPVNPSPGTPPPAIRSISGITAQGTLTRGETIAQWAAKNHVPVNSVQRSGSHVWTYSTPGKAIGPGGGYTAEGTLKPGETLAQWADRVGVALGAVQHQGEHVWTFAPRV